MGARGGAARFEWDWERGWDFMDMALDAPDSEGGLTIILGRESEELPLPLWLPVWVCEWEQEEMESGGE